MRVTLRPLWLIGAILALPVAPSLAQSAPPTVTLSTFEATRGSVLNFTVTGLVDAPKKITLSFGACSGPPDTTATKPEAFSARVPDKLPLGRYTVRVAFDQQPPVVVQVPGHDDQLRVVPDTRLPLKLTAVHPTVAYPRGGTYTLDVYGDGFGSIAADSLLVLDSEDLEVEGAMSALACQPPGSRTSQAVRALVLGPHHVRFEGVPQRAASRVKVQLRVGGELSPETFDVTFSRVREGTPRLWAGGVIALLIVLVAGILSRKSPGHDAIAGEPLRLGEVLLLDRATDTYSLSQFQFYWWTALAIFGYLYLTIVRSLIHGQFDFAPFPEGLPGIIFVSAGTTVLSQGITTAKGPKGAGAVQPGFADLISSGGLVVADRLQYFLWTLVAGSIFVFLVVLHDTGTLEELPKIPEQFLYLMGISAFGYLGGKVARKAGPVIDTIVPNVQRDTTGQPAQLQLTIQGRSLSKDASIQIDTQDAPLAQVTSDARATEAEASTLTVNLPTPQAQWVTGDHEVTVINDDGQRAVWKYTL
ncbi:MAG TPA: hypothetical protein VH877_12540 [Polyangia bacterium]|nr:hypothetical protein [Polyangia bacterium]